MTVSKTETWKSVVGYEGWYEVSDHGRVRSLDRAMTYRSGHKHQVRGRMLRPINNAGYYRVGLSKYRVTSPSLIHRLVLKAFVGPCPEGMSACHNDGVPINNVLSNLRWDTCKSNMADRILHGTANRGKRHGMAKLTEIQVKAIRRLIGHHTQQYIADLYGVHQVTISLIKRGKIWGWL